MNNDPNIQESLDNIRKMFMERLESGQFGEIGEKVKLGLPFDQLAVHEIKVHGLKEMEELMIVNPRASIVAIVACVVYC